MLFLWRTTSTEGDKTRRFSCKGGEKSVSITNAQNDCVKLINAHRVQPFMRREVRESKFPFSGALLLTQLGLVVVLCFFSGSMKVSFWCDILMVCHSEERSGGDEILSPTIVVGFTFRHWAHCVICPSEITNSHAWFDAAAELPSLSTAHTI